MLSDSLASFYAKTAIPTATTPAPIIAPAILAPIAAAPLLLLLPAVVLGEVLLVDEGLPAPPPAESVAVAESLPEELELEPPEQFVVEPGWTVNAAVGNENCE